MTKLWHDYVELAKLRLDWAGCGIDRLEILVDRFLATEPCEVLISIERKGKNAFFSYILHVRSQPPPAISFAVGDIVHNLRATLDNLVWGVGKVFKVYDDLSLEFRHSKTDFLECYLPKINILPQPICDWIESVQPYHRRNKRKYDYVLHRLWNLGKHRTSIVVNAVAVTSTVGYSGEDLPFNEMTFYGSSSRKEKQQVATALVPWERRGDFKPEFTLFVAFDEGRPVGLNIVGDPQNIISYLRDIQSYIVTEVIPKFEPHPS
jgi:hypothetical protein